MKHLNFTTCVTFTSPRENFISPRRKTFQLWGQHLLRFGEKSEPLLSHCSPTLGNPHTSVQNLPQWAAVTIKRGKEGKVPNSTGLPTKWALSGERIGYSTMGFLLGRQCAGDSQVETKRLGYRLIRIHILLARFVTL